MNKMIDYKLVLTSEVTLYIDNGWLPFGSPVLGPPGTAHGDIFMYQAIVKYEN